MVKKLTVALLMFSMSAPLMAAQAIFAGGSFWVMEALFAEQAGVTGLEVGWIQASRKQTRRQVVRVEYDVERINYGDLLSLYWAAIDAQDSTGQYCDRGSEFSPALYVQTPLQQRWAQQSRANHALKIEQTPAVRILPLGKFVKASARHQQYYRQHPWLYGNYRRRCGYPSVASLSRRYDTDVSSATSALSALQLLAVRLSPIKALERLK